MTRTRIIHLVAGTLILTGLALYQWVTPWGLAIPLFVGANLFQSSLSKWCLLRDILDKTAIGLAD